MIYNSNFQSTLYVQTAVKDCFDIYIKLKSGKKENNRTNQKIDILVNL